MSPKRSQKYFSLGNTPFCSLSALRLAIQEALYFWIQQLKLRLYLNVKTRRASYTSFFFLY